VSGVHGEVFMASKPLIPELAAPRAAPSFFWWILLGVALMVGICAWGAWREYTTSGRFELLYAIIALWGVGVAYAAYRWHSRRRQLERLHHDQMAQARYGAAFNDLTPDQQASVIAGRAAFPMPPDPLQTAPLEHIAGPLRTTAIWVTILFLAVLLLAAYRALVPSAKKPAAPVEGSHDAMNNLFKSGRAFWPKTPAQSKGSEPSIAASELKWDNVRLATEYGSYSISGRVANKSAQYTLRDTQVLVTVQDCEASQCTTIGEALTTLYIDVPPGQSRDFNSAVSFYSVLHPRGQFRWYYTVKQTKAVSEQSAAP